MLPKDFLITSSEKAAKFIEHDSPWENSCIESSIGTLHDECLNMEVFHNGRKAQIIVESWRKRQNGLRPYSPLA